MLCLLLCYDSLFVLIILYLFICLLCKTTVLLFCVFIYYHLFMNFLFKAFGTESQKWVKSVQRLGGTACLALLAYITRPRLFYALLTVSRTIVNGYMIRYILKKTSIRQICIYIYICIYTSLSLYTYIYIYIHIYMPFSLSSLPASFRPSQTGSFRRAVPP